MYTQHAFDTTTDFIALVVVTTKNSTNHARARLEERETSRETIELRRSISNVQPLSVISSVGTLSCGNCDRRRCRIDGVV